MNPNCSCFPLDGSATDGTRRTYRPCRAASEERFSYARSAFLRLETMKEIDINKI